MRNIEVDGVAYRWVVRSIDPNRVAVRVWRVAEARHRRLEIEVPFDDPWLNYGPVISTPPQRVAETWALAPVTPGLVARLVRAGLAAGWRSDDPAGPPARFRLDRACDNTLEPL